MEDQIRMMDENLDVWWETLAVTHGVQHDKLLALKEARARYLNERPKLFRMLRALWRVKDA